MNALRAAPLIFALLAGCRCAQSTDGREDDVSSGRGSQDDGGTDTAPGSSIFPDAMGAASLTEESLRGILPPSWHVGDSWEVMFCTAIEDRTRDGKYNTTRVVFQVIAVPEPGAYTAVVGVKLHTVSHEAWVGELTTINGVQVVRRQNRPVPEGGFAGEMIFSGQTFEPILRSVQTQGGISVDYDRIGDNLSTFGILAYTPYVPPGLRNPHVTMATTQTAKLTSALTPTSDGLIYQVDEGVGPMTRCTVFWRRGENWWSYARMDAFDLKDRADGGLDGAPAPDGSAAFAWAVKLPPGQPGSLDCNLKLRATNGSGG